MILALMRVVLLILLGLFFNGIAVYLIFNPNPDSLTLSWFILVVFGTFGLNAWYCLYSGKQAWLAYLGSLP